MATRQYIGARYTPKFSGTYDATQAYEALEVVDNGSGTTYIARKPVPPNTPLTNTEYWLVYGSSSGAILDLQTRMGEAEDDIDNIEGDINTINSSILSIGGSVEDAQAAIIANAANITAINKRLKKRVVLIGDSYGLEVNSSNRTYPEIVRDGLGLTSSDFFYSCIGGASFGASATNLKFSQILKDLTPSVTDKSTITDIIVEGGANDTGIETSATLQGISNFVSYAKTNYPNAKISLFPCGVIFTNTGFNNKIDRVYSTWLMDQAVGYNVINNSTYVLYNTELLKSDRTHPNSFGVNKIASAMIQGILNGSCDIDYITEMGLGAATVTSTDTSGTTYGIAQNTGITQHRKNGTVYTYFRNLTSGLPILSNAAMNLGDNGYVEITLPNTMVCGISRESNGGFAIGNNGKVYPLRFYYLTDTDGFKLRIYATVPTSDNVNRLNCYINITNS